MKIVRHYKQLKIVFISLMLLIVLQCLMIAAGIAENRSWLLLGAGLITLVLAILVVQMYRSEKKSLIQLMDVAYENKLTQLDFGHGWTGQLLDRLQAQQLRIEKAKSLIQQIGRGESIEQTPEGGDELNKAIAHLQDQLSAYRQQEKKRAWSTEGMAKFAELLRSRQHNLHDFSFEVISALVKYVGAKQGAFFIKRHDAATNEEYLELSGAYAYDRKKYLNKRIEKGEGLVGQCLLEKDIAYLTDVPENYISIKSGLGEALPRNIVIVPLISKDEFWGALELASFNVLEAYQLDFLRELSESIAATLSVLEGSASTKALLAESRQLTLNLRASEEEMRQSMEELATTQEEIMRNQLELDAVFSAIDNSMLKAEFAVDGQLLSANEHFLNLLGWQELSQKSHADFLKDQDLYQAIWQELTSGNSISREFKAQNSRRHNCWISATYSPVYATDGSLNKVILIGQDISERVLKAQEHERLSLVADNTDNAVIITDAQGLIEYVNAGFTAMTGYTIDEIKGKKPGTFLQGPETNKATIQKLSEKFKQQESVYEEILNYNKKGESYWVSLAINPVRNSNGIVTKFISVQANITGTKKAALDARYKLEAISRSNAVLEMDASGRVLEANQNFLNILGYTKEDLAGKHHDLLVPASTLAQEHYQQLWFQLQQGQYLNLELPYLTKSGQTRMLRCVYNAILDIKGKPDKMIAFAVDVTEEKRLHQENLQQEVELNHYMASINNTIASLTFDKAGIILEANDIYLSITGYSIEEIKGKSYFDLLPEDERNKPQFQIMWGSLLEGRFFSGEFKQTDKNGQLIWSTGTINPICDINNNVKKVMLLAQFTTKEKEKLQELTNTLQVLKGLVPILELNPDFSTKTANSLFMQTSGYTRMSLKKLDFVSSCTFTEDLSFLQVRQQLEQEQLVDTTVVLLNAMSEGMTVGVTFAPVFSLNQQLDKILLLITSTTGERAKEAKQEVS